MKNQKANPTPALPARAARADEVAPVIQVIDPRLLAGGMAHEELKTVVTVADLVRYLRNRWKISLALALVAAAAVFVFLVGRVPMFESEARVLVKMQGDKVFNFDSVVNNQIPEFSAPALLNNHRTEMATQKFREFVAESLGREAKERFVSTGGVRVPLLAELVGGVKGLLSGSGDEGYVIGGSEAALDDAFTGKLFKAVKVELVKETHILKILVRHESPEVAAEMANVYAEAYGDYVSVQDSEMTLKAREFLMTQAQELRERVVASERKLLEYRQSEGLVESDERMDVSADRRKRLNSAIAEAEIELSEVEQALLQVRRLRGMRPEELAVRAITAYPGVEEMHSQIVAKLREKALLEARYREKHPKSIAFAREFEALTKAFADQVNRASAELENSTNGLKARIVDLRGRLGQAEGEVLAMGDKNITQSMLRSQLEADRSLYDKMVVRLNEASVSSQLKEASHLRLSEKATAAEKAVSPNVPLATILSGMVFFGLFIGFPVVIGMGEDLFRSGRIGEAGDGESAPGLAPVGGAPLALGGGGAGFPVLGRVPVGSGGSAGEFVQGNGFEGVFDEMATEIESRVAGRSNRSVYLITSEEAGVGKSRVAAGLGVALGKQGKKTLIIDANLRAPAMDELFGIEGGQGLAPWLACDGATSFDLESLRQPGTSLYVLPAGVVDEAPGTLLAKGCFARLMDGALSSFDRVIVDSSAAEGCPELFALLPHVGGVVAVSDRESGDVSGLAGRLGLESDRLIGVVLNRVGRLAFAA